jgi:hypothetical protein
VLEDIGFNNDRFLGFQAITHAAGVKGVVDVYQGK